MVYSERKHGTTVIGRKENKQHCESGGVMAIFFSKQLSDQDLDEVPGLATQ